MGDISYFHALTKTENEPKRPKTNQNKPKPVKTTSKKCKTTQDHPKFQNLGNLEYSTSFYFSNFGPKCSKFGILDENLYYRISNLLTKLCMHPISKVLISNRTLVFENFEPKCGDFKSEIICRKFWARMSNLNILGQKVLTFNLNITSLEHYFECAKFKSDTGFQEFRAQMPKYGHFG